MMAYYNTKENTLSSYEQSMNYDQYVKFTSNKPYLRKI